jgi:hypothetical protein
MKQHRTVSPAVGLTGSRSSREGCDRQLRRASPKRTSGTRRLSRCSRQRAHHKSRKSRRCHRSRPACDSPRRAGPARTAAPGRLPASENAPARLPGGHPAIPCEGSQAAALDAPKMVQEPSVLPAPPDRVLRELPPRRMPCRPRAATTVAGAQHDVAARDALPRARRCAMVGARHARRAQTHAAPQYLRASGVQV